MLDLSKIPTRYFKVILETEEGNITLNVEPPKLKTIRKLSEFATDKEKQMESIGAMVTEILNKNKEGYTVSREDIENLSTDQLIEVVTEYSNWIVETKKSKN